MAEENGVLFSADAAERIVDATRRVEAMGLPRRDPTRAVRNSPKAVAPVRVVNAAANEKTGFYEGRILTEDFAGGYTDLASCWVKNIRNAAPSAAQHWARLAGIHTDGVPVFEVIADAAGVEVEIITGICVIPDLVIDGGEF